MIVCVMTATPDDKINKQLKVFRSGLINSTRVKS